MRQHIINIEKGAWGLPPCSLISFVFNDRLYVRQLYGRAPEAIEAVRILTTIAEEELYEKFSVPVISWSKQGTSGCSDIYIRNLVANEVVSIHISMYKKINEGLSLPLWSIVPAAHIMRNLYGYSTQIKYTIQPTDIVLYETMLPFIYKGVDEVDEKEMEEV